VVPLETTGAEAVRAETPEMHAAPSAESMATTRIEQALASVLKTLRNGSPDEKRAALARLRELLLAEDPQIAAAAVLAFLTAGEDAETGMEFEVGSSGALTAANTLRIFLLDLLPQIDTEASRQASMEALGLRRSADEWAVAMRNLAWADVKTGTQSAALLTAKFGEMIANPEWVNAPSSGFLEAFDVPVHIAAVQVMPQLAEFANREDTPLQQAALVAMDTMANLHPLEVMNYLNGNTAVMAERPLVRADYFTKADLTDARQLAAVETYMGRTDVSLEEKTKFLNGLAAPGAFVSDSLLTDIPKANLADLTRRHNATVQAAQQWKSSGRYPAFEEPLNYLIGLEAP